MLRLAQCCAALLIAAAPLLAYATAQASDRIILDGRTERLFTNPLGKYLEANPKVLPEPDWIESGNWRGYVATWEVRDDALILKKIEMGESDEAGNRRRTKDVLPIVFPQKTEVLANWYSGALIIPKGERVNYVHMGYGSTYERYTILVVKQGRIAQRRDLSLEQFVQYRAERFAAYKKTSEYMASLKEITEGEDAWSKEDAEGFLFEIMAESYLSRSDDMDD